MTGTDAAWVAIETPLAVSRLAEFCGDIERLYRINPYLEVRYWRAHPDGACVAYRNLSNNRDYELTLKLVRETDRAFAVLYDRGIKHTTRFTMEPAGNGSRLLITDDYSNAGLNPDLGEVDRSLHAWGMALRDYLRHEARWGGLAPWRWYMRRVWVPMKPGARRIAYILLIVTLAEVALFALVMAIYWAERSG